MRNQPAFTALAGILFAAAFATAQPNNSRMTIQTTSLPTGRVGEGYRALIKVSGGVQPYSITAAGLPLGFSLGVHNGVISGLPSANAVGNSSLVVNVIDSSKPSPVKATVRLTLGIDAAASAEACGQLSVGPNANLHGFVPFAPGDAWITDISTAQLDPNNESITSASGFAGLHLHHDWSSVDGGNYGIPYAVVDSSTTPLVPINVIDYADQSDVAAAPFPLDAPIEAEPADCSGWPDDYIGDSHVLVIDRRTCMLYETFNTHRCHGAWNASSETIWDLKHYQNRPWGWTSGDAAGLPILPGLIRYDEIENGAIHHAIRFTMQHTKNDANDGYFVEPATHAAGDVWSVSNVMGMRIRLKSTFDISHYSRTNQIILTAMKKYGMILADNGSYFYFQGVPDPRWDDDDLHSLDAIQSSNFEVVTMTPTFPGWDSETAPSGAPPVIRNFTASATQVHPGTPVVLTWETMGDSYLFIDQVGGVRGNSVTVAPQRTTTFTLTATNQYGRTTETVRVRVY